MAVITLPPLDVRFNEKIGLEIATTELSSPKQDNDILTLVQKATYTNDANLLKVSPYDEIPHLLNLTTVDIPNQILAKALVGMESLREDYATAPYVETFNWTQIQKNVQAVAQNASFDWKETSFYIVVFRSRIPPTTVYADLGVLDKAAHAEATASGGFLKYWFGKPDKDGRNLATCVWRNQHDARVGSLGEAHRKAAGATRFLYAEWKIERLKLTIKDGARGWEITNWSDLSY